MTQKATPGTIEKLAKEVFSFGSEPERMSLTLGFIRVPQLEEDSLSATREKFDGSSSSKIGRVYSFAIETTGVVAGEKE